MKLINYRVVPVPQGQATRQLSYTPGSQFHTDVAGR